jgi:hypothetical protein
MGGMYLLVYGRAPGQVWRVRIGTGCLIAFPYSSQTHFFIKAKTPHAMQAKLLSLVAAEGAF